MVTLDVLRKLRVGKGLQGGGQLLLKVFPGFVRQKKIVYGSLVRQHVSVVGPDGRILVVLNLVAVSIAVRTRRHADRRVAGM